MKARAVLKVAAVQRARLAQGANLPVAEVVAAVEMPEAVARMSVVVAKVASLER